MTAGATTVLTRTAARSVLPLLRPTGATFERSFAWGAKQDTLVTAVQPFVVEVKADTSAETGALWHGAKFRRVRPDLDPREA